MSYSDFVYDPTASLPANLITDEIQSVDMTTDLGVFPLEGPIYGDLNGFVAEGRVGAGAWETLVPEVDFQYSPIYLEASAKTAKQVYTYIVMIKTVTEVRLTYQVLGTYSDKSLLAELATTSFDRSRLHEWSKIWGDDATYNPRVRDPDLANRSREEIINQQLEKLIIAISNPASTSVVTTADITKLQEAVDKAATDSDLNSLYAKMDAGPTVVAAGAAKTIHAIPAEYSNVMFTVGYMADSGETQLITLMVSRKGTEIDQAVVGEVLSDSDHLIINVSVLSGQIVIDLTSTSPGTVNLKVLFAS